MLDKYQHQIISQNEQDIARLKDLMEKNDRTIDEAVSAKDDRLVANSSKCSVNSEIN